MHFVDMLQYEQRVNVKFLFELEKTATKTLEHLSIVYGGVVLRKSAVYDWFKRFKHGQESRLKTKNGERSIIKFKKL